MEFGINFLIPNKLMDTVFLIVALTTTLSALSAILGYLFMRQKFLNELAKSKIRQEELKGQVYETAVLKEIGERIGYSLDAIKIIEIISGSLGSLMPYSVISRMTFDPKYEKIRFDCNVKDSVSLIFINEIKQKMIRSISEITQKPFFDSQVDESIYGNILNEQSKNHLGSFFNLPFIINGKLVGLINVSSVLENLYDEANTAVLYRISKQASDAVSKLQDVLEAEKSRLSQAVQSLTDGLLMVDRDYHLVLVNKKLCNMLSTVSNPSLFDIVNALSGKLDLRSSVEETIASENDLPVKEIIVKDKVLQIVTSKVLDKSTQKVIGVIVLFHDVTDAKSLEKLRQDFTSMMVHELRSPLTSIKSTADLITSQMEKIKKDEISQYLKSINSTSQSMLELVNDLLDVAKMESDKFDVICQNGDFADLVAERVEVFKPQVSSKDINLTINIEKGLPKAYFDVVRMKQVFNNLLSNAIKFTRSGEIRIKVETEQVNGAAVDILVSIADSGIGIDPEEGRNLFSRFGQLVRGRQAAAFKGSGLGLYIAKGIVEASGGRIWFSSPGAGMGTTFYFTVPLARETHEETLVKAVQGNDSLVQKITQAPKQSN